MLNDSSPYADLYSSSGCKGNIIENNIHGLDSRLGDTLRDTMSLGVSSKTIKRYIKEMKYIRFVGRGSNGHWEVDD